MHETSKSKSCTFFSSQPFIQSRLVIHPTPGRPALSHLTDLQIIGKDLVHLGDAGGHGEINCAVADLDDEAALDVGVNLVVHLELLALADVLRLGDCGLEAAEGLVVEWLGGC